MENKFKRNTGKCYSDEVRERAVRLVLEHSHEYSSQSAAIAAIAPKIGCGADTLRKWVDWFNNKRLLAPIGYIPPNEKEITYYENLKNLDKTA